MTKKTQSLKIGISCPQEVGFQPRTGEGDTYLWLYTRRKKKRGFSLRTEFPCTERQSGICTLCVAARREKSARCCNCFAEPLQIGLHHHCKRLAESLQQTCSETATSVQQNRSRKWWNIIPVGIPYILQPKRCNILSEHRLRLTIQEIHPIIGSYPKWRG